LLAIDFDELLSVRAINFIERISHSICEFFSLKKATLTIVSSLYLQSYFKSKFNIQSVYLPYAAYLQIPEIGENPFTCPTAVYMGNLHPDGDHDILLDAWSILKKQGKDLNLCMIGGGSRLESFRAEVRKRKLDSLITVMGYLPTSEMWNRLCHAHILLFPIRDTIGNRMRCPSKTFAYMQAGRPIVTCRVGEVPKALGEQGIYIEPKPEAFAKKVTEIFSQPVSNINYNLELHSWQYRAEELLTAIEGKS
jgi:glycosyltransferase involved in cell wall biosynthesis